MCPEVGFSDVIIKMDCGYTCSEELNTMLVIAMLVLLISLWSPLSLASIPGVLGRMGEKHMVTFLQMVDTNIGCLTSRIWPPGHVDWELMRHLGCKKVTPGGS